MPRTHIDEIAADPFRGCLDAVPKGVGGDRPVLRGKDRETRLARKADEARDGLDPRLEPGCPAARQRCTRPCAGHWACPPAVTACCRQCGAHGCGYCRPTIAREPAVRTSHLLGSTGDLRGALSAPRGPVRRT